MAKSDLPDIKTMLSWQPDVLVVWVIYKDPKDYLGLFVLRPQAVRGDEIIPASEAFIAPTLERARAYVPPGLVRLERHPDDEPQIVETWI